MNNGNSNLKNLLSPFILNLIKTTSSLPGLSTLAGNLEKMTSSSPIFNSMHLPSPEMLNSIRTNNHLQNIADKLDNLPNAERLKDVVIDADKNRELLWLEYTAYQEVVLNRVFLLHKCQAGGMNDRLLQYLLANPNQIFTRQDLFDKGILKSKLGNRDEVRSIGKETKTFFQFPEDIGISGDLKKLFFGNGLSKDTICLTNPITKDNLNEARVGYIDISLKPSHKPRRNKA